MAQLQESLTIPPPDVCADMKAWAQSGYRLLSPASRALRAALAARYEQPEPDGSLSALLKPSEGAAELALLRRTSAVEKKLSSVTLRRLGDFVRLLRTLGSGDNLTVAVPGRQGELGRGRTHSGRAFTVRRASPQEPSDPSCHHPVWVEMRQRRRRGNGIALSSSSNSVCLSATGERRPAESCNDGEASITTAVPSNVRTVQLRLSDGSFITSAVVRLARKDGGPAGVYVQAIRAERRYPVSLTELDRHGHVVGTVVLTTGPCKKEPREAEPTFVSLVEGTVPGGQPFTIKGVLERLGAAHRDFSVTADVGGEGDEGPSEVAVGDFGTKKAFRWSRVKGCPPRPFALLYGILEAPGDSVLARTPEGLVPLSKLALASNLGARGPLVYGAFVAMPSELIVRRSDGTTLYSESLAATAKEDTEFCEGFAEG